MYKHFSDLSTSYNTLRTTDHEPVIFLREKLQRKEHFRGADIGCGGGRYSLLLLQHLPGLHLICGDANEAMVQETARYLEQHGQKNFSAQCIDASSLQLPNGALDFVIAFNAIHHFDPVIFLKQAERALRDMGYVFVYTRFKSQNARSIWGRFFPKFAEKETRLYELTQVEKWSNELKSLALDTIRFFRFRRAASLSRLTDQAKRKHYSTFSLYPEHEFDKALGDFIKNVKGHFSNPENIRWIDENVMLVFRKEPSHQI